MGWSFTADLVRRVVHVSDRACPASSACVRSTCDRMIRRVLAFVIALVIPAMAAAQFGYWSPPISHLKYDDQWVFTRLRYRPNSSWSHDYPRADRHLAYIVADISMVRAHTDASNVFDIGDPEIFRHPLIYMSEPGFWDMTDADARNLR